jgi:small subunit ribosomal protein S17
MAENDEQIEETPADASAATGAAADAEAGRGKRSEKIGVVASDKMQKTVVVRVDRLVKHPVYKRYVRRRSKFMAHNEIDGVSVGDQVRIVETRPLSARKRWRVVEVLRKASK